MIEAPLRPGRQETGFAVGPWRVDPQRNVIVGGGEERHLENRLMQTLVFLAEHQGEVVSRAQFFDSVWRGRVVNEEALSRAISLLRTTLGDDAHAPKFIQTVPGVGYRLIADVVSDEAGGASSRVTPDFQPNSIAVLPFVNLSDDASNEYFSDGVSEEILNVLSQIEHFKVVGRTSCFMFKGRNEDLREVGRTLNVTHVLEGSVRKADARVRITAQLIKTDDGYHVWSQTFDRELDDVLKVQDEIAAAVVKALRITLLGESSGPKIVGGTDDIKAYQAYLLGMHYRHRGALKETVENAVRAFERATGLDPNFAKAHASLAISWAHKVWNGYVSHAEGIRKISSAAHRAIELAPDLADGYLALAHLLEIDYQDKRNALDAITRAVELHPGNAQIQVEFARLSSHYGDSASIAAAQRAIELDPVSVYANHVLGHVLYFTRHYREAITALRHTLEMDPHYPKPHYFIGMSLYWLGETEAALEDIKLEPLQWMRNTAATVILHRLGRTAEAGAQFAELVELGKEENNYVQQADVHAQLGDTDQAFRCLELALSQGDPGLTQLMVDPFLDPIRDDPRFDALLEKVGLEEANLEAALPGR